jgi:hypothetical protein
VTAAPEITVPIVARVRTGNVPVDEQRGLEQQRREGDVVDELVRQGDADIDVRDREDRTGDDQPDRVGKAETPGEDSHHDGDDEQGDSGSDGRHVRGHRGPGWMEECHEAGWLPKPDAGSGLIYVMVGLVSATYRGKMLGSTAGRRAVNDREPDIRRSIPSFGMRSYV